MGIQLSVPGVPPASSPIALGQAIALDFNDSWRAAWWRRTVGYKAFAERFRSLIAGETGDFMTQLKFVQTADAGAAVLARLQGGDDQRDILLRISDHSRRGGDVRGLLADGSCRTQADHALKTLRSFTE
ncbi:hypothetical protein [Leisingera methylohalidivorans]|uniref:hypothetical protein n=1 Tax=Leisingera methylohalidivorans TaxID=133924 RepID=UPI0018D3FE8B